MKTLLEQSLQNNHGVMQSARLLNFADENQNISVYNKHTKKYIITKSNDTLFIENTVFFANGLDPLISKYENYYGNACRDISKINYNVNCDHYAHIHNVFSDKKKIKIILASWFNTKRALVTENFMNEFLKKDAENQLTPENYNFNNMSLMSALRKIAEGGLNKTQMVVAQQQGLLGNSIESILRLHDWPNLDWTLIYSCEEIPFISADVGLIQIAWNGSTWMGGWWIPLTSKFGVRILIRDSKHSCKIILPQNTHKKLCLELNKWTARCAIDIIIGPTNESLENVEEWTDEIIPPAKINFDSPSANTKHKISII